MLRRLTTLSTAFFVAVAGLTVPAAGTSVAAAAPPSVITLVTGDRVQLTNGKAVVEPGPGRSGIGFLQELDGADIRIVPADAAPLLARGQLDRRLFNVSELVRQGFAGAPALPLIVSGPRPLGMQVARTMTSLGAVAVTASVPLWQTALSGSTRIWLDGRAHPVLDRSTVQIGAPAAWQAGFTGKGVTIADLDGGWDPEHPDLKNVVEAVDFTGTGIRDGYGHGTHTASIIAGTGAASAGKYRGVAPDASVIVGKVCEDSGGCPESAIIAGMEWAASKGAAAVNLSLGGAPTDGTDPMSLAVNRLTASTGTLFVIAAGNFGLPGSVGTPGAADAALTVGSVTKTDGVSSFTSRGPRIGDFAVKPDIAAPGSSIVAARSKGTSMGTPVNDFYTSASGTSMATPHVTGAAALLKQAHPTWGAAELKTALMNSAHGVGLDVYTEGAGRLDVARALDQIVRSTPASVSFPYVKWPRSGSATRTVSYRNDSASEVRLSLSLSGASVFSLAAKELVVPAGGSASVDVTASASGPGGSFSGVLVASAGSVSVRTPLGVTLEEEKYTLSIDAIGHAGAVPWFSSVQVINTETGISAGYFFADPKANSIRVPKGKYDVHALVYDNDGATSLLSQPDTVIGADVTVSFDARKALPLQPKLDREASTRMYLLTLRSGNATRDTGVGVISSYGAKTFAAPSPRVTGRKFQFVYQPVLVDPSGAHAYNLMFFNDGAIPDPAGFVVRDSDLASVRASYRSQGKPTRGVRGGYAYLRGVAANVTVLLDMPVPFERTEYYTPGPDVAWDSMLGLRGPTNDWAEYQVSPRKVYSRRSYSTVWNRGPFGPSLGSYVDGWGLSRDGDTISASIPLFSPMGDWAYTTSWGSYSKASTTLSRDGVEVDTSPYPGYVSASVDSSPGVYTLTTTSDRQAPWSVFATSASATWKFRSPGTVSGRTPLPLLAVRPSGDFTDGVAPSGPFVLDLKVDKQAGATYGRIGRVSVEVSYDDGATWSRVPVIGTHALLCHRPGFVSLRLGVSDSLGNSVSHTVVRAYQVAPR
ncbi:serine protease [Lentzea sp. NBRC 105346]|uniref:S8 family serine peptidase n=1 Tax=Lentzea sp. NBRC 105346 TaxID=3032205 RepID=UPI0024A46E4E|nr:S8 family serine peptidase [Lentzea sp. NBRC 105346]GLZ32287.1 serine protease [Lentzea sp. NBRC 105346]